jgi:hypothetical protein
MWRAAHETALGVTWHRILCPLNVNSDERMEILALRAGFEEDGLLAFTFDGRHVAGVLGMRFPVTGDDAGAR